MIYLAAPYWHEDPFVRQARVIALSAFHAHLVKHPPRSFYYNPLANSIGVEDASIPEAYWVNHGLHMLRSCQALYVLCLEGWQVSKGVGKEIAEAQRLAIPVHYFDTEGRSLPL
jgi:hypothetical protein